MEANYKLRNTLVMMGIKSNKAMFIDDALQSLRNSINKEVQASYRNIILDTEVMGKTFRKWFVYFKNKPTSFMKPKDFDIDDTDSSHLNTLIEMVLQEYYKKEYKL